VSSILRSFTKSFFLKIKVYFESIPRAFPWVLILKV